MTTRRPIALVAVAALALGLVAAIAGAPPAAALPATQISVTGVDTSLRITDTDAVTVTALDALNQVDTGYVGRVVFTTSSNFGNAMHIFPHTFNSLEVEYTFTPEDQGSVTFLTAWQVDGPPGQHQLTITGALAGGGTSSSVFDVDVGAVPIDGVELTDFDMNPIIGVDDIVTLTARDANGDVVPSYIGTVFWNASCNAPDLPCASITPAIYTFTPADAGVRTFAVRWLTSDCGFIGFDELGLGDNNGRNSNFLTCSAPPDPPTDPPPTDPPPTTPTPEVIVPSTPTTPTTSAISPATVSAAKGQTDAATTATTRAPAAAAIPRTGPSPWWPTAVVGLALVLLGVGYRGVGGAIPTTRPGAPPSPIGHPRVPLGRAGGSGPVIQLRRRSNPTSQRGADRNR